jgi:hypothetical protein
VNSKKKINFNRGVKNLLNKNSDLLSSDSDEEVESDLKQFINEQLKDNDPPCQTIPSRNCLTFTLPN